MLSPNIGIKVQVRAGKNGGLCYVEFLVSLLPGPKCPRRCKTPTSVRIDCYMSGYLTIQKLWAAILDALGQLL
ncbi:unnamed protein product [Cuscuta campestris]|uniref:Uncharacterized protein n=1 Tax=Cuscuta campestris TaxID=132261 RepID=A0A484MH22_9ASTE|nr:unnamed protein product [Cuscuta campestris]